MSNTFDVCIRGDGVVGRAMALLLAKERLRVALVAPAAHAEKPDKTDVRAYALNSASRQLLQTLRAWPEENFATPVLKMQVWGDVGGAVDFHADGATQDALAWIVDVSVLENQLAQACLYQGQIERVEHPAPAALSIICEGQKSTSRGAVGAHWSRKPYAQKAIAARFESSLLHGGVARQWFAGGVSGGEVLAFLPMGGAQGNSMALVWSVSDERAASLEQLAPDAFCAELATICGPGVGNLHLTSGTASWPLAMSSADRWVGPGWALAGDAAHTVHPLAGQGLNLGLADAASLSGVLASREYWRSLGDEKLLRRYERARKAEVAAVAAVTDGLHNLFAHNGPAWQSLRNWGMNGFASSTPLKNWLTRRAAGLSI